MANEEQLAVLRGGVEHWNTWREAHPDILPDLAQAQLYAAELRGADLNGANLRRAILNSAFLNGADLSGANMSEARLESANLTGANLRGATLIATTALSVILTKADLRRANLIGIRLNDANLIDSDLREANVRGADLRGADMTGADLSGADLSQATLVYTRLTNATLDGCRIHGISAWDVDLEGATQTNLCITPEYTPEIVVDNLAMAQFLYFMLHNENIREVIDTLTSKVVLLLGRFTPERKAVLDGLREGLRALGYVPVLFDFDGPESRDVTETVTLLARMARFVVVDLTDPSSVPMELQAFVPDVQVPVQCLLLEGHRPFSMFSTLRNKYTWVLPIAHYTSLDQLLASLKEVIGPAEELAQRLAPRRAEELPFPPESPV